MEFVFTIVEFFLNYAFLLIDALPSSADVASASAAEATAKAPPQPLTEEAKFWNAVGFWVGGIIIIGAGIAAYFSPDDRDVPERHRRQTMEKPD